MSSIGLPELLLLVGVAGVIVGGVALVVFLVLRSVRRES
jgi:hypothetical protein